MGRRRDVAVARAVTDALAARSIPETSTTALPPPLTPPGVAGHPLSDRAAGDDFAGTTPGDRRPPGNVRVGRLIEDYLARRLTAGAMSPWELPIVVACRDLIADTVAQLPMLAYRAGVPRDPQPAVVVRPDPYETRFETMHRLVNNLTGHGYAWLLPIARYASGDVSAIRVLDASAVAATFDPRGVPVELWYDGNRYPYGPDGIVHVPFRVTAAGTLGRSPLADSWRTCEYLAALWQMAGSYWEAGFPSMALVIDQALTGTQRTELKDALMGAWSRTHEPAVIDRGGRLESVGSSAVEADLVSSISVANAEVARLFGVMPSLVNVQAGDSLTYSTTETEFQKWLKVGLGRYLARVEAGFSDLLVYGTVARFDTAELLRTDQAGRARFYADGLAAGWLTIDEVRQREGLTPLAAPTAGPLDVAAVLADPPLTGAPGA